MPPAIAPGVSGGCACGRADESHALSCAYDFANLAPRRINFFRGGVLAAVLSVLPLPWHLYNNPDSIAYFVGGLGAFLGSLFGVLMVDYWIIKRGHIDVDDLYTESPSGKPRSTDLLVIGR